MDGGRIKEAFQQAFKRCQTDCADRPGVEEARKVTLTVVITPELGESGDLDSCNITFTIKDSLPDRKSKAYNMTATANGKDLLFNEISPDDARQLTVDEPRGPVAAKKGGVNAG
jgi:hypothetical protein